MRPFADKMVLNAQFPSCACGIGSICPDIPLLERAILLLEIDVSAVLLVVFPGLLRFEIPPFLCSMKCFRVATTTASEEIASSLNFIGIL